MPVKSETHRLTSSIKSDVNLNCHCNNNNNSNNNDNNNNNTNKVRWNLWKDWANQCLLIYSRSSTNYIINYECGQAFIRGLKHAFVHMCVCVCVFVCEWVRANNSSVKWSSNHGAVGWQKGVSRWGKVHKGEEKESNTKQKPWQPMHAFEVLFRNWQSVFAHNIFSGITWFTYYNDTRRFKPHAL